MGSIQLQSQVLEKRSQQMDEKLRSINRDDDKGPLLARGGSSPAEPGRVSGGRRGVGVCRMKSGTQTLTREMTPEANAGKTT